MRNDRSDFMTDLVTYAVMWAGLVLVTGVCGRVGWRIAVHYNTYGVWGAVAAMYLSSYAYMAIVRLVIKDPWERAVKVRQRPRDPELD